MTFRRRYSDLEHLVVDNESHRLAGEILTLDGVNQLRILELHLTDLCNLRCSFCLTKHRRLTKGRLDIKLLKSIILEAEALGLQGVRISGGGDPTCNPDLVEFLEFLAIRGIAVSRINTNGVLLSAVMSRLLVDCRLMCLHISLQAPTPQLWSEITGAPEKDFFRVISNIETFQRYNRSGKTNVVASFALHNEIQSDSLVEAINLCHRLGVTCHFHDLVPASVYTADGSIRCEQAFKEVNGRFEALPFSWRFFSVPNLIRWQEAMVASDDYTAIKELGICFCPWTGCLVRATGEVYACCILCGDSNNALGSITNSTLSSIWQSSKWVLFRKEIRMQTCQYLKGESTEKPCCQNCPARDGLFLHQKAAEVLRERFTT